MSFLLELPPTPLRVPPLTEVVKLVDKGFTVKNILFGEKPTHCHLINVMTRMWLVMCVTILRCLDVCYVTMHQ